MRDGVRFPVRGLLVRFDDSSRAVFVGAIPASNGMLYVAAGELESDIYLLDLVRK